MKIGILQQMLLLLTTIFFLQFNTIKAQNSISGMVKNLDGEPIIGASVTLIDKEPIKGGITDFDGHFLLIEIPAGRYTLAVSYSGCATVEQRVILREDGLNIDFTMDLEGLDLPQTIETDAFSSDVDLAALITNSGFSEKGSQPAEVTNVEEHIATAPNYYVYGVFIAINNYDGKSWAMLKNPVNDADSIAEVLTTKYAFDQVIKIYDETATRRMILDTLSKIVSQLGENDQLLIYYSGHSMIISGEGYWIPYTMEGKRTQMISNTEIKNIIAESNSRHILLMADGIFGNSVFQESENYYKDDGEKNYYQVLQSLNARQAIVSGNNKPVSNEGTNSVFATNILKCLYQNDKELLATSELFDSIKLSIAANSPKPIQFGHVRDANHESGQFLFPLYIEAIPVVEVIKDCSYLEATIKEGKKITFKDDNRILHASSNQENVTYQWFTGIHTLPVTSPDLKVVRAGEYTVVVTDEKKCTKAATIEVEIIYKDAYVNILQGSEIEFVEKGTLTASTNVEGLTLEWLHNNFIVGEGVVLEVNEGGIYTVNLKSSDGRTIATASAKVNINSRTYIVQVGDDVERLARKFYNDEHKKNIIINANPSISENNGALKEGEKIIIPTLIANKTKINNIKLGAIADLSPLSSPGIYKNGIVTDISMHVFKEMNVETSVEFMPLNKLKAGTFNGMFTAAQPLTKSSTDELSFYFSLPLYKVLNVLFVKANSDLDYTKDKDLKGKRIAVAKGVSIRELDILAAKGDVTIVPTLTLEIAFQMLAKGEIDMVASSQLVGLLTLKNMTVVNEKDFKTLDKELGTEELYFGISKNNPNAEVVIADFNNAFLKLQEQGKIQDIINEHVDQYQKP